MSRTPTPPGYTLADMLQERSMASEHLAELSGLDAQTINGVINGTTPITTDIAVAFERCLGTTAAFWLTREAQYQARKNPHADKDQVIADLHSENRRLYEDTQSLTTQARILDLRARTAEKQAEDYKQQRDALFAILIGARV